MKFRFAVTAALLATTAAANTLSAQGVVSGGGSWQSGWTPGTQTNEFWNRLSDDGTSCNIGYFVQGGFGPCTNSNPGPLSTLGWTNSTYLAQALPTVSGRQAFSFSAGRYNLSFLGQIAGANPARYVGVMSADGSNTLMHTFGAAPESYAFTADRDWVFFLQPYAPAVGPDYRSDASNPQWAVFANSNGANGDNANEWLVGGEDNSCLQLDQACARISDYDFNDALVRVSAVPEPSTYALMTVGLVVIGGAARRRRQAVKA